MEDFLKNTLINSVLFKDFNINELEDILHSINYIIKKYKKGQLIALKGNKCNKLLILLKGTVNTEIQNLDGKVLTLRKIKFPFVLAATSLFGKGKHFITISSSSDSTILEIAKNSFFSLLQNNSNILKNYLDIICNRVFYLSERLDFLVLKTIKEKFAYYILNMSMGNDKLIISQSLEKLSEFFGVTIPSLSRVLNNFIKNGIIEHPTRKLIIIKNRQKLIEILNNYKIT